MRTGRAGGSGFPPEAIFVPMSSIDLALWEAYIRAEYWAGIVDPVLLKVGERATGLARIAPVAFGPEVPWAFLTAWNPGSEIQKEPVNRVRQAELEACLREAGHPVLPGVARDPSGEWPDEESLLVFGLGWEKALMLGRRFSQNAIIAGLGEETVQLLRC